MEDVSMKKAKVHIQNNGMEAWLTLPLPEAGEGYTRDGLLQFLRSQRVTYGVDEDAVQRMVDESVYMHDVCVARGLEPVNGESGRIELHFDTDLSKKPRMREDGTVDYRNIHTVEMVKEGQVIATYIPPTEATNGMSVLERPIPAVKGKPLQPMRGKGFHIEEDGCTYVADLSGKIELVNGQIRVSAIYEVPGNVGVATGNVDYHGDVVIHGDIEPGSFVRTSGSLTVDGTCENCFVEAGKDIVLRKGVLGGGRTTIRSGGNIHAKFFEYCKVSADGFIEAEYALDSHMVSYDKIYMTGKKGSMIGGYAYALAGVEANVIGNSTEVRTHIHVGVSTQMMQELAEYQRLQKEAAAVLEKIRTGLQQYDELAAQKGVDVSKDPKRVEILRYRMKKQAEVSELQKHVADLSGLLEKSKGANVQVVRRVYPGTVVSIDQMMLGVKEMQQSLCFKKRNDGIIMESLV